MIGRVSVAVCNGGPIGLVVQHNRANISQRRSNARAQGEDAYTHVVSIIFGSVDYLTPADIVGTIDGSFFDGVRGFRIRNINIDRYSGAKVCRSGDMDGDGLLDLVLPSAGTGNTANKLTIFYGRR